MPGWKLFVDDDADGARRPDLTVESPAWRVRTGLPPVPPDLSHLGEWVVARSAGDAIGLVAELGFPDFVSFDHDLGDGRDGMAVAWALVDEDLDNGTMPEGFAFEVHSGNPVGAANLRGLLCGYMEAKAERPARPSR